MENEFFHLHPTSNTLPHDIHLSLVANGSIPEESPVDNRSIAKELENTASGDSSYETADDVPSRSDNEKTALDNSPAESLSEEVGVFSRSWKLLFSFAVCLLLLLVAIAVCCDINMMSYLGQNFTSTNNTDVVSDLIDENHTTVHENHTSVHENHTTVHENHTTVHENHTTVHENHTSVPLTLTQNISNSSVKVDDKQDHTLDL